MKPRAMSLFAVVLLALGLGACATVGGHGTGPIDSFTFLGSANPGLSRDVVGRIIAQGEPELINVVVPHGIDMRKLIASVKLTTNAVVSVMSGEQRIVQTNGITANDFSSPVLYSVEIPGEKEPWRYRVVVREADTNARLAQVTLPARAVLQPAFSAVVDQYTIQVPFETRSLSIAALAQSPNPQSVTIGGTSTPGHLAVGEVDFSSGQQTTFPITVLAEDGTTKTRYTFVVKRNPPDKNALLGVLSIPDAVFTQPFSPAKFAYSASVSFEVREVTLNAQAQSPFATVSVMVPGGSGGPVPASRGANAGNVRVDFPSGREAAGNRDGDRPGRDHPEIQPGDSSPGGEQQQQALGSRGDGRHADPSVQARHPGVHGRGPLFGHPADYSRPAPGHERVNQPRNGRGNRTECLSPPSVRVYPGEAAGLQVEFSESEMKGLNVVATAQNGETLRYTLLLHRSAPDRTADLASLTATAGVLAPAFSAKVDTFTLRLPADATGVQVTAAAASQFARVSASDLGDPCRSQSATVPVDVDPGQKTIIRFFVTAEDGTQKLFQVQVTRDLPK